LATQPALAARLFDLGKADHAEMTLAAYLASPSTEYVFDARVLDEHPALAAAVELPFSPPPPPPFPAIPRTREADYLHHLSSFPALRPDWRWLLVGHPGAGFGMHVDPNATHAWNTLLRGRKRWAFLPPGTPPEVAAPDDDCAPPAREWFASALPRLRAAGVEPLLLEQAAGETVLVPSGWWHTALTVGEEVSVAVTANFLCRGNFEREARALARTAPAAAAAWAERVAAAGLPFTPWPAAEGSRGVKE
jgi:hypothetical protein